MPLDVQVQGDFSGGMYRTTSRELIPANGAYDIVNGLLEEDGTILRRGGSVLKATVPNSVSLLWDGYLGGGSRTVFGLPNSAAFGVLNANDTTTTTITPSAVGSPVSKRPAAGNGLLAMISGANAVLLYGGSRNASSYAGGTATVAVGGTTLTGVGTAWLSNAEPGDVVTDSTVNQTLIGVVASVQSNTSLTLTAPALAALSGAAATIAPVSYVYPAAAVAPMGTLAAVAAVGNPARLCVAIGSRIYFSYSGNFQFADPTDYHEIPQGGQVLGMESLRNILFVFTTSGVFTISNMDFNLTDAQGNVQHRMEQINRDLILWDQRGIAGARGALVVPGVDDVYLVSDAAAPQAISKPISALYRSYVAAGYQCGGAAVFRDHYILPILSTGGGWIDTLVCRLNGGGWTRWVGDAATSGWMTVRGSSGTARAPQLFSAYDNRIQNLTGCFSPVASNRNDADGSTHQFEVTTRDYTTSGLRSSLVKKVRLGYELVDAAADNPTIGVQYATAQDPTLVPLSGTAGEAAGQAAQMFLVNTARSRFVRFTIYSFSAAARMSVKCLEVFTRAGGRQ